MSAAYVRSLLLGFSLVALLSHCSSDEKKKVERADAGAGSGAGGEAPEQSGGATASAGSPEVTPQEGGAAGQGAVVVAGQGGAPPIEGGAAGTANEPQGGACNAGALPVGCCDPNDPPCADGWTSACYDDWDVEHSCCDTAVGVRRTCVYDGDFYTYSDKVCLDACSGKSFGTGSCGECLSGDAVACSAQGCPVDASACEDPVAGYALDCSGGTAVTCTCDPAL